MGFYLALWEDNRDIYRNAVHDFFEGSINISFLLSVLTKGHFIQGEAGSHAGA